LKEAENLLWIEMRREKNVFIPSLEDWRVWTGFASNDSLQFWTLWNNQK